MKLHILYYSFIIILINSIFVDSILGNESNTSKTLKEASSVPLIVYPTIQASNIIFSNIENTTSTVKSLAVAKANQTITFNAIPAKVCGTADFDPGATSSAGLPITYTSSNNTIATIVANQVHIVGGGTVNITAKQAGNTNYNAAASVIQILTVSKLDQTITFNAIPAKVCGTVDFDPGATSSVGLPITYTTDNNAIATIVAGKVHIVGGGTVNITAQQAGNTNYNAATSVIQILTVSKLDQTITFNAIPAKVFGTADFNPGATNSAGLPITYTSSNSLIATIVANQVRIVGGGTVNITAQQAGNTNYNEATSVIQSLTISKANQTITFNAIPDKAFGTSDFSPGATVSSGLIITYTSSDITVATIVASKIHILKAGTVNITAQQSGNTNYNGATSVIQPFTVSQANQTITFNAIPDKAFGTSDFSPGATVSSGLIITYTSSDITVATIVASKIHILKAGTVNITAQQSGNTNYNSATPVIQTLNITIVSQNITFNPQPPIEYTKNDIANLATINTPLTITYTSSDPSIATIVSNKVHIVALGSVTITASQAGNTNYTPAANVSQNLTFIQGHQIIMMPTTFTKAFSNADYTPATVNSGLALTYTSSNTSVATIVNNKIHMVGIGVTTISASQAGNTLFYPANVVQVLTIIQGSQVITFNPIAAMPYADIDINPATTNSNLTIDYSTNNPAVAKIINGKLHIMGSGTAIITANQPGNANFSPAPPISQNLIVNYVTQSIIFPPINSQYYGNPDFNPGAYVSTYLPITYTSDDPSVAQIVNNQIHIVNSGSTMITAYQAGNASASPALSVSRELRVITSTQDINFDVIPEKYFGDADFNPGATSTSGLPVDYSSDNPNVATIINGKIHIVGVGTTTITCSQSGNELYYPATNVFQIFSVHKGSQTITFPYLTDVHCGDANFPPGATTTSSLLITYTSSNTNVAIITGGEIHIVGAGTTIITANQVGNANYNPAPGVTAILNVNKSNQVITFNAITPMDYEDIYLNPATSSVNLPINYISSDNNVAVIVNNSIHIVGSGTTVITALQPGNMNYLAATPVSQSLTINQINQSISFDVLANKTFGDADFNIYAFATSDLPVVFTSSNPLVATVTGNTIHVVGAGNTTITAQQPGDITYKAASIVSNTLTVFRKSQEITFPSFQSYKFGNGDIDLIATDNSGLPIVYSSDNTSVAIIVAGKVHIVGPGITNITAKQSGDINYMPASDVSRIFMVNKSTQTISFNALPSVIFGDADITLSASSSSGLPVSFISDNTNVATIIGGKVHFVSAGSANIIAIQGGDSQFDAAPNVSNVIIVNNTSQSIIFPAISTMTYGDADQSFSVTATSGLTVSFINKYPGIASIINGKIHILQAGIDTIIANQPGNATYLGAVNVPRQVLIQKANQSITLNAIPSQPKVFGDPNFTVNAIGGNSNNTVTYISTNTAVATVSGNVVTIIGSGTTSIIASQVGNINYNDALPVSQNLTVTKAANTITFDPLNEKYFSDPDFDPIAISASGLPITYSSSNSSVATIINGLIHITGSGYTTITANQSGDGNFNPSISKTQDLFVNKQLQTITFNTLPIHNLGDLDFDPGAIATSGLPILYSSSNLNVAIVINGKIHITGGGSCIITATQPGNNNVEESSNVEKVLFVNGISQTITFDPIPSKSYGIADIPLTATSSSGQQVTYVIDNPDVAIIIATTLGYSVHLTGVGTATISADQSGNLSYKAATTVTQLLTVVPGNQTISFPSIALKTFGDPDFSVIASTISGLPITFSSTNDSIAKIVNGKIRIMGAGTVNIIATQNGDENYKAAATVSKVLTIQKEVQHILFPVINNKTYGDADFDPGAYSSAGINIMYKSSNIDVATISFNGTNYTVHILKAGTTTITASQPGDENHLPASNTISKTFIINKALLTVTADNFSRSYGVPNPTFTLWYTGFVNGDDFSNFGQSPVNLTTATINSAVGAYDIIPTGGYSDNYRFVYINGTLTIGASIPEKPEKPVGQTLLCINPDNQVYQLSGTSTASTYKWSVTPSDAGIISGTGKIADLKFDKIFTGRAGISAIGENPSGKSTSSDTLFIDVLAMPMTPDVIYNNSYCKNNDNADSIVISNSQKGYLYQLMLNNSYLGTPIAGTDERLGWYKVYYGAYSIKELYCNTIVAKDIKINEVNGVAKKPRLQLKWNDVIVCNNSSDSIKNYQWYQDGLAITDANLQYLWTQKKMGQYFVAITDIEGCQTTSDTLSINTTPAIIYPNPNSGQFKVTFTNTENGRVSVNIYKINSLPLKAYTFTKNIDVFEQDIDLNKVSSGIYFIELNINDKRILYEKLIIQ